MNRRLCFLLLAFAFVMSGKTYSATDDEQALRAQKSLERRQRIELLGFFLKDPKDAAMPQTPLAIEMYNEGVRLYEKKEYDLAFDAFQDSLKYNPNNSLAYELMGDIRYYQQRLPEAKKYYQNAFELQPREGLKTKLEKLREETVVEKDLSTYREQHFIIKYHGEEKSYEGFDLREMLRETYGRISKDFGFYFNQKVVVLLYDEDEFKKIAQVPHWASGLYDGKIRMPAYKKGFTDKELRTLTAHEMTHAFVSAISLNRAPVWLNEGLAVYEEDKVEKKPLTVFKAAVRTNQLIPLALLTTQAAVTSMKDPLRVALFYEESFNLSSYLIDRYGMFRVKQLLEEFGKGKDTDEAMRNVLKISVDRLEREWKATF